MPPERDVTSSRVAALNSRDRARLLRLRRNGVRVSGVYRWSGEDFIEVAAVLLSLGTPLAMRYGYAIRISRISQPRTRMRVA